MHIPGNILEGNWRAGRCTSTRARATSRPRRDARRLQREARRSARRPRAADRRASSAVERAPISHRSTDGAGTLKVGDKVDCAMHPTAGPDGSITTLNNSIFSTVPGSPAYVAKADHQQIDIPEHGYQWELRGQERDPVRLEDRLPRASDDAVAPRARMPPRCRGDSRGDRAPGLAAIAAQVARRRRALAAPRRADRGRAAAARSPRLLFLLAWQVMIAAMMLPSSLPLVRLFARASARRARPRARDGRPSSAATRSSGSAFGARRSCSTRACTPRSTRARGCERHDG